jgi:hypothetical protein
VAPAGARPARRASEVGDRVTATGTQSLLRELIDIPEQVSAGDLVTELASAVNDAERTVEEYVVTP